MTYSHVLLYCCFVIHTKKPPPFIIVPGLCKLKNKRSPQDDEERCLLCHSSRSWRKKFDWRRPGTPSMWNNANEISILMLGSYHPLPSLSWTPISWSWAAMNGCWWRALGQIITAAMHPSFLRTGLYTPLTPRGGYIMEPSRGSITLLWCVRTSFLQNLWQEAFDTVINMET